MGKGKPRHNPQKRQNLMGMVCQFSDDIKEKTICAHGENTKVCKGNPHNCIKILYRKEAAK